MTQRQHGSAESATETHHEPHGGASPHGAADDVPGHDTDALGGHDEHGHGERLGPVDTAAWGAGAFGVLLGLVVVACFALASGAVHL
jgi:hypothetical protein